MTESTKTALEVGNTYTFTTVRGTEKMTGKLLGINKTAKGDWFTFLVDSGKEGVPGKEVKTRRAAVQA